MFIMKKILICYLTLALLAAGCSLDEEIKDTPVLDNFFVKPNDITLLLNGTYGLLESGQSYKGDGHSFFTLFADDIYYNWGAQYAAFAQKKVEPGYGNLGWVYWMQNRITGNLNYVISIADKMDADPTYKARIIGEAKFLRGLTNFNMVRWWGGIPLRTEPTDLNTNFYIPRNSVEEVYNLIISDFKTASESLLPKSKPALAGLGRTNKGAAQAMLAKAYLTYGNMLDLKGKSAEALAAFKSANAYADSVILSNEYSLIPNYADLWNVDKEKDAYNKEVIFGIRFTRDKVGNLGSDLPAMFLPSSMPNVTGNVPNRVGQGQFKIQPWFYDFCTSGDFVNDYRSEVTFATQWTRSDGKVVRTYPFIPETGQAADANNYLKKYIDGSGIGVAVHENDWFVIRLSEVYLIKAEAENEINGPNIVAYSAFNKLRERARKANGIMRQTPADLTPGLTKEQFRMKIFEERGLEFVGEGMRWFDLVRMKSPTGTTMYEYMFKDYLPNIPSGLPLYNLSQKKWLGGRKESLCIPSYNSKNLLFPIPNGEREKNPLIEQNPGY